MIRWLLALAVAAGGVSATVRAQDFAAGVEAFDRGDHETAWFVFWEMAQKGDQLAQFNLGQMYRLGLGVPVDINISRRWYEAAANQGHARAQFSLGVMHEFGYGVPRDIAKARGWYQKAAAQNIDQAREALARLDSQRGGTRQPAAAPAVGQQPPR